MPRTCTICNHPQRDQLERALLDGALFRHIATRFDTSTGALQRHKAEHLPKMLVKAHDAQEVARADSFAAHVQRRAARLEELDANPATSGKRS